MRVEHNTGSARVSVYIDNFLSLTLVPSACSFNSHLKYMLILIEISVCPHYKAVLELFFPALHLLISCR